MIRFFNYTVVLVLISAVVHAQKPVKVVQPKTEFDVKLAAEMLNEGKSGIKGVAYYEGRTLIGIKSEATVYARVGAIISLYPVTPYLEEYLQLKQKNKAGKQIATINPLAASFRIETKILSEKGEFVITGLKPGKYYLQGDISFPSGIGVQEVSNVVEIKKDGEMVSCKLHKIYRGFIY
jgi:hypothetical protein